MFISKSIYGEWALGGTVGTSAPGTAHALEAAGARGYVLPASTRAAAAVLPAGACLVLPPPSIRPESP